MGHVRGLVVLWRQKGRAGRQDHHSRWGSRLRPLSLPWWDAKEEEIGQPCAVLRRRGLRIKRGKYGSSRTGVGGTPSARRTAQSRAKFSDGCFGNRAERPDGVVLVVGVLVLHVRGRGLLSVHGSLPAPFAWPNQTPTSAGTRSWFHTRLPSRACLTANPLRSGHDSRAKWRWPAPGYQPSGLCETLIPHGAANPIAGGPFRLPASRDGEKQFSDMPPQPGGGRAGRHAQKQRPSHGPPISSHITKRQAAGGRGTPTRVDLLHHSNRLLTRAHAFSLTPETNCPHL